MTLPMYGDEISPESPKAHCGHARTRDSFAIETRTVTVRTF